MVHVANKVYIIHYDSILVKGSSSQFVGWWRGHSPSKICIWFCGVFRERVYCIAIYERLNNRNKSGQLFYSTFGRIWLNPRFKRLFNTLDFDGFQVQFLTENIHFRPKAFQELFCLVSALNFFCIRKCMGQLWVIADTCSCNFGKALWLSFLVWLDILWNNGITLSIYNSQLLYISACSTWTDRKLTRFAPNKQCVELTMFWNFQRENFRPIFGVAGESQRLAKIAFDEYCFGWTSSLRADLARSMCLAIFCVCQLYPSHFQRLNLSCLLLRLFCSYPQSLRSVILADLHVVLDVRWNGFTWSFIVISCDNNESELMGNQFKTNRATHFEHLDNANIELLDALIDNKIHSPGCD